MKLDFSNEHVLAVVAHPDDAELLCAGTLARAKSEGAEVGICVMTRGDKGQGVERVANLGAVRCNEMAAAAKLLGARLFLCGYPDAELADTPPTRRKLVEVYRAFRPTLVLAHSAEDYHPDHRVAGVLAEAASWFAASPGHRTKGTSLEAQPAVWWMDTIDMIGFEPGFYVDISEHTSIKHEMLHCHESQLARGNEEAFTPLEELMQRQYRARGGQVSVAAAEAFRAHHAFKRGRAW